MIRLKDAVAALKAAGFTAKTQAWALLWQRAGVVIRQTPAAGTQADPGSQVTITISNC